MVTISLCMIVRDEEKVLARCLQSADGIADEVIVVDTGSTDGTRAIAAQFGQVYDFVWCDDFAAARNFSFRKATMDYCLWLDADDVIAPADRARFLRLKERLDPSVDMVLLPYHTAFDGQGNPTFTYYRERLIRRGRGFCWQGAVHECITPAGHIVYGDAAVQHRKCGVGDPDRNLRLYERQLAAGKPLDTRGQFYYARELLAHTRYAQAAQAFEAFLAQPDGWIENRIEAYRQLAACRIALGQEQAALHALTETFALDIPRAETCCALGECWLRQKEYRRAAFWYELALQLPVEDMRSGAFVSADCRGYLPCIQLCVCWGRLGDRERAMAYNERAAAFRPDDPAVAHNRAYFEDSEAPRGIE